MWSYGSDEGWCLLTGVIGLTPDGHQVERWFFWLQQPAAAPAQPGGSDCPIEAAKSVASSGLVGQGAYSGSGVLDACSGTGVQAGNASDVAARLRALISDPPQTGARNAFRRAMQDSEDRSCGTHSSHARKPLVGIGKAGLANLVTFTSLSLIQSPKNSHMNMLNERPLIKILHVSPATDTEQSLLGILESRDVDCMHRFHELLSFIRQWTCLAAQSQNDLAPLCRGCLRLPHSLG